MAELPSLSSLPIELIDLIIETIPQEAQESKRTIRDLNGQILAGGYTLGKSRSATLQALCLCSRRMNDISTAHLYRCFEDKSAEDNNETGVALNGHRLLLLLRTVIRNPERGRLIKHVVASTWSSLDTRILTEADMKAVFEQAGMITSNYPLRMTDSVPDGCIWLGPPPHQDTSEGVVKESPSLVDGYEILSNGQPAPFDGFTSTDVDEFLSHPQYDFPLCSAASWCHAIRVGEWDAIFTLLLSYLPHVEIIGIYNPDAGESCPFAQCIYLTSFMERVAISQQVKKRPHEMKAFQMSERSSLPEMEEAVAIDDQQEPLGVLKRKRAHSDTTLCHPSAKRQKVRISTNMLHTLPGTQGMVSKRQWLADYLKKYSLQLTKDKTTRRWQPLLPRFRSMTVDCIYRSSDVCMADVVHFIRPKSVEEFHCSYLYAGSWPGDTKFSLKVLKIKHGHLNATSLSEFIRCCTQLKHLSFETAGGTQMAYQSLATPGVMAALDTVAGTLENLDLMKVDMNYWNPALDVTQLQSYTAYTFRSFAGFSKLKRLCLKAESMIRHSESDPDADTGPLWAKLPPSLEYFHLAGNKKWFGNLIPQIQELISLKSGSDRILPRLKKVVLEFREMDTLTTDVEFGGRLMELASCEDSSNVTVIRFGKVGSVEDQTVKELGKLLEDVLETAPLP